jgi:hypothetical protein
MNLYFLEKYWPDQEIVVLGYEELKKFKNTDKVKYVSLGKQAEVGKANQWTNCLIDYFKSIEDEYFILILEDFFLMDDIDLRHLRSIESEIKRGLIDKAMIGGGLDIKYSKPYNHDLVIFDQNTPYRASLHPAVWKREYFLKYAERNMSPWEFEVAQKQFNDGAVIVQYDYNINNGDRHTFTSINVYQGRYGMVINKDLTIKTSSPNNKFFKDEDLKYILRELGKCNVYPQ